jgi:hypothetical protein
MRKRDLRKIEPEQLAKFDVDMWFAYYNHRFFRLFILLFQMTNPYFRPNVFLTIRAAYHSALAAAIFRKTKGHENDKSTRKHLVYFYKILSDHDLHPFDYRKAADLELKW